ncbi:O-antigen ligase [Vibrio cholerae]|nr:O-antigen ligase [Vibrio cholerae]
MSKSILQSTFIQRWFTVQQYDRFMFTMCLLYSLSAIPLLPINDLFKNIVLIGSLPILLRCIIKKEGDLSIFLLLLAAIIIQVLSWYNSLQAIPEHAYSSPRIKTLSALFFFVLISFWVRGKKTRVLWLYASLIIGFIFTALYQQVLHNSLALGLSGQRIDLNMHNAQYTSMLSVVVIGLTLYITANLPHRVNKVVKYALSTSAIVFALYVLVISQSRQVWLALLAVLALSPLLFYRSVNLKRALVVYLCLTLASATLFNVSFVKERVFDESGVISQIADGKWDNIPMTSVGIRVNSWLEASKWIARSPIIGSDRPSVSMVIRTSEKFRAQPWTLGFGHLHNFYMETLVSYGVVGLIFIILLYRAIFKNVWQGEDYRKNVLLLAFLIFWAIVNCFESYNTKNLGLYAHAIVLAGLFSYLPSRREPS